MRVDKLKTNLGDTIKIIFKTKMEYEKWLQYVKDVCITRIVLGFMELCVVQKRNPY